MTKRALPLIICLFTCLASAQESSQYGETLEVRIINVDVVVTDRDGNPIPGLTEADFEIFENGRRQPVTNFAEYRTMRPGFEDVDAPLPPSVAVKPPEKRYLVLFIDRLQLTETINREEFFRGLRAFAEDSMREGDEAAIFYFGTSLHTMVAMTPDKRQIVEAIDVIEDDSRLRTDPEAMELSDIEMRARMYASEPGDGAAAMEELDRRQAAQRAYDEQRRKTLAMNAVLQSVAGLEGRRVMILATYRFSKLPGLELGYPSTEFDARKMMDAVVDNANAAGVTIYGFHPFGLAKDFVSATTREQADSQVYQLMMNQAETIESLASRTGGIAALGGKLSAEALDRTTQHLDNYYSLAYRAPDSRDDRERKIRVNVSRPDVRILVRNSVIDKSEEEVAQDRLIAATLFGESESAIKITAKQTSVRKSGLTTYIVPVEITIPIAQLTALPTANGYEGRFRVMAAAANAEGDVSDVAEKEQTFRIPAAELAKARAGTFTYEIEIKVRDTTNRAVVAVWDEIDKESGYVEIALDLSKAKNEANVAPGPQNPTGRNPRRGGTRWPR